jgi:hypothetical protein
MTDDNLKRAEEKLAAIKRGAAERAKDIQPNQCPGCGAYRLDGHPPEIHKRDCPWHDDGLDRTLERMYGGADA